MTRAAVRSLFNLGVVQLLAPARQLILSGKKKDQLTRKKLVIIHASSTATRSVPTPCRVYG
jgi:hypothetical protein